MQSLYYFMHQHEELYSPELIRYFIKELNAACGWDIPVPKLYNDPENTLVG